MQFDEQLISEISLCKTRDDHTFPLKAIKDGKQTKIETILYNLNKIINPSNIGKVDYTEGGIIYGNEFHPLNDVFSDNIVVYVPIDDTLIPDLEAIKAKATTKTVITDEDEDKTDKSIPKPVRDAAKNILAENTEKIKRIFNALDIPIKKPNIKPTNIKRSFYLKQQPSEFVQLLKVDLSSINVTEVNNILINTDIQTYLNKNNIYIHDIDFTRDYSGVFYKPHVVEHLLNIGYRFQKTFDYTSRNEELDLDKPKYIGTVLDNDNTVSRNCLTFIRNVSGIAIRYKFYNKFVQSMESPSVRKKIGSNISNWINNPELYLNRAINKSIDTGLLRLEITFYANGNTSLLTKEFITEQMDFLQTQMDPILVYRNSIQKQFNLLCDKILYNICIYDTETKTAFISLYQNTTTGKVNGFYVKEATSVKLSNALRYYCSNKPIVLIIASIDYDNGLVSVQQDVYVRVSSSKEELFTYVNKGSENLRSYKVTKNDKQPTEVGLMPNTTFNFKCATSAISLERTTKYPIIFKRREGIDLLKYPSVYNNLRSINKVIRETAAKDTFDIEEKEIINKIKEENDLRAEEINKERIRHQLYEILKNSKAYTRKLIDLEDDTILYIYAFKPITTRWGNTFLLVCSTDETINNSTELNNYWSTTNITNFIGRGLSYYKKLDINKIIAYGTLTGTPIITIKKTGTYISSSNNKCAAVEIVTATSNNKEDIKISDRCLEELPSSVKVTESKKLDKEVTEGDKITVLGIRLLKKTVIIKAAINDREADNYVISYWLKEIVNKELANNIIFSVVAGPNKTTPNKKAERLYVM